MFSEEKYEKSLFLVILPPHLPLTARKLFRRPTLIILWVSLSSNLPFTVDYLYLWVDLCFMKKKVDL